MLILDNFTGFSEGYSDQVADIAKLVREGGNYGIYLVSSANAVNSFPYRISQNIKQSLVFQMADKTDYASIVGRTEGLEPAKVVGRGLAKDKKPLEFQAALPVNSSSDDQIAEGIRGISKQMKGAWKKEKPSDIVVAPESLSITDLLERAAARRISEETLSSRTSFPIALDMESAVPVDINVRSVNSFLISHAASVQIEGIFNGIIQSVCSTFSSNGNTRATMFDSNAAFLNTERMFETGEYLTTKESFLTYTRMLVDELQIRRNDSRHASAAAVEPGDFDEAEYISSHYPAIILFLPDLHAALKLMEDDSLNHLERIARFGKGLGVLVIAASEMEGLNQLHLMSTFVSSLVDNKCGLLIGGNPLQHISSAGALENKNANDRNRPIRDGEAVLMLEGTQQRVRLAT